MVLDQIARVIAVQGLEVGAHLGPFARNVSGKPLRKISMTFPPAAPLRRIISARVPG